jgi:hypothetical protein
MGTTQNESASNSHEGYQNQIERIGFPEAEEHSTAPQKKAARY